MFIARIKYSRQAIPTETEFATRELAEAYAVDQEFHNPYVRWTEIIEKEPTPST